MKNVNQRAKPAARGAAGPETSDGPLLSVENLFLYFKTTTGGIVRAVDGVSFELNLGRSLAIVGESGCGKTSLAKAILRLLPRNVAT
jgi:peptide/nickel transport system ATP-binding protein